jgi:arylsulfatase A-like enzyme
MFRNYHRCKCVDSLPAVFDARVSWLVIPVCIVACSAACSDAKPPPPNVLLISVDSLRRDHVSAYGYRSPTNPSALTTPAVDRLAQRGVLFEDAVSTTSWTLPAHMALLTGLPDVLHGVTDNSASLDPSLQTLAELLHAAGYSTAGFFSGPNLHPVFGFDQGFDRYVDCSGVSVEGDELKTAGAQGFREANQSSHHAVTSPRVLEESSRWIEESVKAKRPFFAFTHWWDPHYDYLPPAPFDRMYDASYAGAVRGVHKEEKDRPLEGADLAHLKSLYDGEIRWTDDHVGKLLDLLERLGVLENTLVVFTSDHGEEFFERGRWGHQRTLFDEVVRIPLVMSLPRALPAGGRVRAQARLQDIYPTIAETCGVRVPAYVEGRSLRTAWQSPSADAAMARVQPLYLDVPYLGVKLTGARASGEKVLWDSTEKKGLIFDLVQDPTEREARSFGELLKSSPMLISMLTELERARSALPERENSSRVKLPPELEAELKALGYLGDDAGK